MKWWSPAHQAVLNALDAQDVVPELFNLLTSGVIQANERDTRRLRDWPEALRDSPSWTILADAIQCKSDPQMAWNHAQREGFSDRAAHHNALLLLELSDRLAQGRSFAGSLRCVVWARDAWSQLYSSGYLDSLVHDLDAQLPPESTVEIVAALLCPTLEDRRQAVLNELQKSEADLDSEAVSHGHKWFDVWRGFAPDGAQLAADRVHTSVATFDMKTNGLVAQRMAQAITDIDLTTANDEIIEAPFRLAWRQIQALGLPAPAICELIGHLISTLWTLRRVGRDSIPAFADLVDIGILVAPHLAKTIESGESIGQNSRLADLYVFRAERDRGDVRREFLGLALKYCPGHRNASMLMSYQHLYDAQAALALLATTIRPASVKTTLQKVHDSLKATEAAFPLNEDLAEHWERFQKACLKNKIVPGAFDEK